LDRAALLKIHQLDQHAEDLNRGIVRGYRSLDESAVAYAQSFLEQQLTKEGLGRTGHEMRQV